MSVKLALKCCQVYKVKKLHFLKVCTRKKPDVKQHIVVYILFLSDNVIWSLLFITSVVRCSVTSKP